MMKNLEKFLDLQVNLQLVNLQTVTNLYHWGAP